MDDLAVRQIAQLIQCLPATEAEQLLRRLPNDVVTAVGSLQATGTGGFATVLSGSRETVERFVQDFACHRERSRSADDGLRYLAQLVPSRLTDCLLDECPQTVASILMLFPPARSAALLLEMPDEFRSDVLQRVAQSQPISDAVREIVIGALVDSVARRSSNPREQLAKIMRHLEAA